MALFVFSYATSTINYNILGCAVSLEGSSDKWVDDR